MARWGLVLVSLPGFCYWFASGVGLCASEAGSVSGGDVAVSQHMHADGAAKAHFAWLLAGVVAPALVATSTLLRRKSASAGARFVGRLILGLVCGVLPWCMLLVSCHYYWQASTPEGRTTVGWGITFWTVVCGFSASLLIAGMALAGSARPRPPGLTH